MIPQPFVAGGNWSYPDFWAVTGDPRYPGYKTLTIVWLHIIMESIQCMVPQNSPLITLAQQGAEAVGQIVAAEPLAGNHRGEPSIGNWTADQAKHA
jgi:hypothetical protein